MLSTLSAWSVKVLWRSRARLIPLRLLFDFPHRHCLVLRIVVRMQLNLVSSVHCRNSSYAQFQFHPGLAFADAAALSGLVFVVARVLLTC